MRETGAYSCCRKHKTAEVGLGKVMRAATLVLLWSVVVVPALGSYVATPPRQARSAAKSRATIPADITSYGLIFLRARVNNSRPLWLVLDSGASFRFVVDTRLAKSLGLNLKGNISLRGGAGPGAYDVATTQGVSINLGPLKFTDQTAAVIALGSLEAIAGRRLDGLVGRDLFNRYVVEIDYVGHQINLYDPQSYTYSGAGESIPLTMRGDYFFVPAKIEMPAGRRLEGQFLVDTGGGLVTAILNAPFAKTRNLPGPTQRAILDRSLSGLGGEMKLLVCRATSFALGNLVIRGPVIYLSQDSGGALASSAFDGVLGGEILRRFNVIFDYARGRLILEPNAHYAEPVEYDMSGIRLRAGGRNFRIFRVYQVLENSPAANAGLREGDVVVAIDGVPASKFSLDEVYRMLKQIGLEHTLSIRRGSVKFSVKIKLKRLI